MKTPKTPKKDSTSYLVMRRKKVTYTLRDRDFKATSFRCQTRKVNPHHVPTMSNRRGCIHRVEILSSTVS
jgi:hypothetical protein